MTRMWLGVPPSELCDQHLLGEHKELHQEVGTLRNHPHGEAVVRGHVERGQVTLTFIEHRHAKLAEELESRGMNHNSPLDFDWYEAPKDYRGFERHKPSHNRDDLADRCDDCAERMGVVA